MCKKPITENQEPHNITPVEEKEGTIKLLAQ